jgi:aromatic-L-amino-acid decarboxylase
MNPPNYLLELSPEEARRLGHEIVDRLIDYQRQLPQLPVVRVGQREQLEAALREPLPASPQDPHAVVRRIEDEVFAASNHETHPRFFAFIPGPSNFVGALAEFLRCGYNIFAGSWLEGSGPAMVEMVTLDWIRQLAGYPESAAGIFLSGGSLANLSAIVTARDAKLSPAQFPAAVVYGSDQVHSSIDRALRILGFRKEQLRRLPSDAEFRLRPDALQAAIAEDRTAGRIPFCVIANAGTTNTGTVDPLEAIADICSQEDLWLHADGAYGAAALFSPRACTALHGLARADSFSLDPHKWLFQPFDCALLLVRDPRWLKHAFHVREDEAEYLQDARGEEGEVNLWDYSPELTRPFRALKVWMSLQVFGAEAFAAAIDSTIALAEFAERELRAQPCWQISSPAQMAVLTFRYAPEELRSKAQTDPQVARHIDSLNRAIAARMQEEAFALVLTTELRGNTVLRLCTINPRTTEEDISKTIAALTRCAKQIHASESAARP